MPPRDAAPPSACRRRAILTTGLGTGLLAVAAALPWVSLPGGQFARALLAARGDAPPALGAAWHALPLTFALLAGLVVLAGALTGALATSWAGRVPLAWATAGYGVVLLAVLVQTPFAGREAEDLTAVGAGGYLGAAATATIVGGALLALRDARAPSVAGPEAAPGSARREPLGPRPSEALPAASWRSSAVACLAIVLAYGATRALFVGRFPAFFDEALYAEYAEDGARSTADLFRSFEVGQGPLPIWLGIVWVKLGFTPLAAMRLVSITAGLLTVAAVGVLARWLWGAVTGWVAAGLCVAVPFLLVHDGIGIYEPLVALILAVALLLQLALAWRPSLWLGAALGVVLAAGILTKQNTLPALALIPVSLLCFDWSPAGRGRRLATWLGSVGLAGVIVLAVDLLQRTSDSYALREAAATNVLLRAARPVGEVLDDPFAVLDVNWTVFRPVLTGYLTIPLLLFAVLGAVLSWRVRPRATAVLLAWIIVPAAIVATFQLRPAPRHAMIAVVPVVAFAAHAFVQTGALLRRRLPGASGALAGAAVGVLVLAPALTLDVRVLAHPGTARYPGLDYWQYVAGWPAGGPWRRTAQLLRHRGTGEQVVMLTPGVYRVLRQTLGASDRYVFAAPGSVLARRAQFGLFDEAGLPVDPKGFDRQLARLGFVPVARFARPSGPCSGRLEIDCGDAVRVYVPRVPPAAAR